MPHTSRKPAELSGSLHHRLNSYALAAGTAGIGLLALTPAAMARIIYTPTSKTLTRNSTLPIPVGHTHHFELSIATYPVTGSWSDRVLLTRARGKAAVAGDQKGGGVASALHVGKVLGPRDSFQGTHSGRGLMAYEVVNGSTYCGGNWDNVRNRYLGLKFDIAGHTHYGWARLTVSCSLQKSIVAKITGYAYETIPNKPIITGKTKGPDVIRAEAGSLGALAAGRK